MDLSLQFGYGMMRLDAELLGIWKSGDVILSPRDLSPEQIQRHAKDVRKLGGTTLLDPQFYLPHADHSRLCSHSYWPEDYETGGFWTGNGVADIVKALIHLNQNIGSRALILPGLLASAVDDDWLAHQRAVLMDTKRQAPALPILATIALGADAVRDEYQVQEVLEDVVEWECDGYYVVLEHPSDDYLVEDNGWLANSLDLVAGLRLREKEVLLGYCTHQMLIAGAAAVSRIASGTWMNVRSFPPEKFITPEEDEDRRKAIWYYCPQSLSEYQMVYLDTALERGLLPAMATPDVIGSEWAKKLFLGPKPTTVRFSQPDAFAHYLHCLRYQAQNAIKPSYAETIDGLHAALDSSEALVGKLRGAKVFGKQRDFSRVFDATRSALSIFDGRRGAMLRRRWDRLR